MRRWPPLRLMGAEETTAVGRFLGERAGAGDFYALTGELGAGKTTLALGALRGLGIEGGGSPTFLLVRTYHGRLTVYHVDLYRLGAAAVREELDWEEYFEGEGVALVEWADLARSLWPPTYLELLLERPAARLDERWLTMTAEGARYEELATEVSERFGS